MEKFLIDDGIKQSKIVANRYKWSIENADMGSEDANELHADICNQYVKEYEQIAEWLEELKSYKDIGTLKELKELKENGTFTGLELAKLAIMQKELKEYKDLEEHGLLVRLPCRVGDTVWDNDFGYPESYEIKAFSYGYCDSCVEPDIEDQIIFYYENYSGSITGSFPMSEIGKTVFLTREEADKKLEELKNEI
jgi:hypothetical protein